MKKNNNNSSAPRGEITFYSTRGVVILIIAVVIFAVAAIAGMYALGVIKLPSFISDIFADETVSPQKVENIAPPETEELYKALPAGEYAIALADMPLPEEYYRSYSITLSAADAQKKTDYVAIKKGDDWWVQISENDVILNTALCNGGIVKITDNASNSSITSDAENGVTFKERCGIMPLGELTELIRAVESGEDVAYGGGITTYSLSFTQSRGTSENIFNFSFSCENGISEEYIFAFESAAILSAKKTYNGETIYQMELKDSRNDLSEIDVDALLVFN